MKQTPLNVRMGLPLACMMSAIAAHAATPPAPSEHMPPPGLYRVNDIDSHLKHNLPHDQALQSDTKRDGKSGDESRTTSVFGESATMHAAGTRATTLCVPAPKAGLPHTLPAMSGCSSGPPLAVPGGLRFTMHCAHGDTVINMRHLYKSTWEFENRTTVKASQVGRGDAVSPMRAMLEAMVAKGTPAEKAEAKAHLANLPKMEAQMKAVQAERTALAPQFAKAGASAAAAGVSYDSSKPVLEKSVKYTITRIGDSCGAVAAVPAR